MIIKVTTFEWWLSEIKIYFSWKCYSAIFFQTPKAYGVMVDKKQIFCFILHLFLFFEKRYVDAPINSKTGPTKSKVALHLYGIIVIRSILNWYSYCNNCYVINFVLLYEQDRILKLEYPITLRHLYLYCRSNSLTKLENHVDKWGGGEVAKMTQY